MLTPRLASALVIAGLLACPAQVAWAQGELAEGMRRPERITVGIGDQYLGQLAPDGRTLYFVSNRNTTNELFQQDVDEGRARVLFDEGADVNWPRISPDGRTLLYVSYRDRATGQLCLRDLPAARERRCFDGDSTALQAEWIDSERIALVSRASISGDLTVLEVTVGPRLTGRPLLQRNLISPAVSPDGRWLVYVPVERFVQKVGPAFAARAAPRMEVIRLDRPGSPAALPLQLPGFTGQPAFSRDGRHLYFVQFMSDSNHDGFIDANDHGVLFRVPFKADREDAPAVAAQAPPEQLTQVSWNCQYPSPSATRLVFTCSRAQYLDIYALPLDGVLPSDWTVERIATEIALSSSRGDELLLRRHLLARGRSPRLQALAVMSLIELHLQLEEFAAAEFYARRLGSLDDPATAPLSKPLLVLVEHRQALRERESGRATGAFRENARRRMQLLVAAPGDPPPVVALLHVIASEVADSLGDVGMASRELSAVRLDDTTPPAVLTAYYAQADAHYRKLDDRPSLVAACRRLATHPSLAPDDRDQYARAAVRAMYRGVPSAEADALLARERAAVPDDSELAFALDLARVVLAIREERPPAHVVEAVLALYRRQTRPERRRAVVVEAVRRATDLEAEEVTEALAQEYVRGVKPGTMEQRRVERFYTQAMLGRAYRRISEKRLTEAREDFDAVTRVTGSLETVLSSIDMRLRSGELPAAISAEHERGIVGPWKPVDHVVKAYLLARALPKLTGEEHARAVTAARAHLRSSWKELKKSHVAQALFGAILHEEYLRTGSREVAVRANTHFLVALELVRNNPRYRAMILGQLALLHTHVGNYRIALGYLDEREKLPFADNAAGLAVRLARARALLHVDREDEAASIADKALAMVQQSKRLAVYRPLALDRAALYSLAASRFQRALELYDLEMPLLESDRGPEAQRNRLTAHLARAAAALGAGQPRRALDDLDVVDGALKDPARAATLRWRHAEPAQVLHTYRLIAAGLRANASQKAGRDEAVTRPLSERRDLLLEQFARSALDEDLRELVLVEARLAVNAAERHELPASGRWLGLALGHADALADRTRAALVPDQLMVLRLAGELGVRAHAPLPFDLPNRLSQAHAKISERNQAAWRSHQRWYEIYLTLGLPPEGSMQAADHR